MGYDPLDFIIFEEVTENGIGGNDDWRVEEINEIIAESRRERKAKK